MNTKSTLLIINTVLAGGSLLAATPDLTKLPPPSTQKDLTYVKDIRPIFEASCFNCHGDVQRPRGGLRLDSLESVLKGGGNGKILIPGTSEKSHLVIAVSQIDRESAMPPPPRQGGRGGRGGFGPGATIATQMISQGDKNSDQKLDKAEFATLADAWYDKLDVEKSGKLSQEQFTGKLGEILPMPQRGGPGAPGGAPGGGAGPGGPGGPGGGQGPGGGRGGFNPATFVGPGLFTATDANKDSSLTRAELKETFAKWAAEWDAAKSGSLDEEQLRTGLTAALPQPNFGGPGGGRGPGGPGGGTPPKPLTPEQVGLVRAWIDQGAK